MDLFEFLLVIVSIVLGLGIAELLGGVVRILRGELPWGKLHTLWVLIVLQFQMQLAWGMWGLHDREAWTYPEFMLLLLGPGVLYMAAAVLFPSREGIAADEYLLLRRRPFFLLNASYVVLTSLFGVVLFDEGFPLVPNIMRAVPFLFMLLLARTASLRVHWPIGIAILAGHVWWTYQFVFAVAATPAR